ncbi:MobC family plasmid mobilization relaxosome protein [Dyadobacter sp. CY312]|uniref:MobC family plasmid mobilization relaxosome protein n=1 Tax=Dyadobacter sp. CY312 TaxID=2907303 RepID=UPI001F1EDA4B|nr:MobC family plasmid mobilization relaxosome protein [Dyadobacter sp. CY312]
MIDKTEMKDQKPYNPKGGRPPKKIKLDSQLMVRLTQAERFLIASKAKEAGMKPSVWFRHAAKKAKVVARLKPEDAGLLRMLAGMANNLNQMTHLAHVDGLLSYQRKCRELLSEIDDVLKKLTSDDR